MPHKIIFWREKKKKKKREKKRKKVGTLAYCVLVSVSYSYFYLDGSLLILVKLFQFCNWKDLCSVLNSIKDAQAGHVYFS